MNWISGERGAYNSSPEEKHLQDEEEASPIWNEDEPLRAEVRGFTQEQMVTCENCLRANPPTRASCLYCGAALPVTEAAANLLQPLLRPLETWEQGFNAILLPGERRLADDALTEISDLLKLETETVERMMTAGAPLPLARAATEVEAALIEKRLATLGFQVLIVADKELDAPAPQRLRAMEMTDDFLGVYATGSQSASSVKWADIALMVAGRRILRRLEVAERPGRKKEKELVDSRELSTDEPRLDLYLNRDAGAWRVAGDNFDFSCLREKKSLVASQNFQTLTGVLRERAKDALYDDSYLRVRTVLSLVWPLEQHTESLGLRKRGMGPRVNTEAVTTSDNEMQFTRYSKLLHHLKLRGHELKA
ncbi:MAG TPA: hypothetical protein VGC91_11830 [Pyrinomonadaceae bacterium]